MGDPSPRSDCVSEVRGAETHAHGSKSSRADEMDPKVNGRSVRLTTRLKSSKVGMESSKVGTGRSSSRSPEVIGKKLYIASITKGCEIGGPVLFFFLYFFLKWGYFFFLMGYFFLTFLLLFPYFRKTGKDRKNPCMCTTFILVKRQEKEQERTRKRKIRGARDGPGQGVLGQRPGCSVSARGVGCSLRLP